MDTLGDKAREAVANLRQGDSNHRFPDSVREVVLEYARERRGQGESWATISRSVGLSESSLFRWATRRTRTARKGRIMPVEVVHEPEVAAGATPGLVLVSGNYRIEGLDVASAAQLLGRLS